MADGEQDTCPQQLVPSQVVPAEALRGATSLPLGGGGMRAPACHFTNLRTLDTTTVPFMGSVHCRS